MLGGCSSHNGCSAVRGLRADFEGWAAIAGDFWQPEPLLADFAAVERRLDRDAITDAVEANVITEAEAALLRLADQATDRVIRVDDFDPDELAAKQMKRAAPHDRAAE